MTIDKSNFNNLDQLKNLEITTPAASEEKASWSKLLGYLHSEDNYNSLNHWGIRVSDLITELWNTIDLYADLDNGTYSFFTIYNSEGKDLWNDSLEWIISYIFNNIDVNQLIAMESTGILAEKEDGSIDTSVLKASIPVTYNKEKVYLYPDLTGDNSIKIIYDGEETEDLETFTLDDIVGTYLYAIFNTENNIKKIFFTSETIEEAYQQFYLLFPENIREEYYYAYFFQMIEGINEYIYQNNDTDESKKLQNTYYFLTAFLSYDFDINFSHRIQSFVIWCNDNREELQNKYGVKINIDKGEKVWTLTIYPNNSKIFGLLYKDFCDENDYYAPYILLGDDFGFRITDVRKADAGNAFVLEKEMYQEKIVANKIYKEVINSWVVPWYNINARTYKQVRSDDRINSVLTNDKNLQFTITQNKDTDKYIRLIMPEYKREVEIEDLNRNFWVIAQVISAICSWLFDEDSPYNITFKSLLNEIMQLWENVMYLWIAAATQNSLYYEDTHIEVVYLPFSTNQPYLKYDFNQSDKITISETEIEPYIDYMKQIYTEENLCIIVAIKDDNYAGKYYHSEIYKGALFYDRNTNSTTWLDFGQKIGEDYGEWQSKKGITINAEENSRYLYGVLECGKEYYWCAPIKPEENYYHFGNSSYFYGGIRVQPNIGSETDGKRTITLQFTDVGQQIITSPVHDYSTLGNIQLTFDTVTGDIEEYTYNFPGSHEMEETGYSDNDIVEDKYSTTIQMGWDVGEFPSCRMLSKGAKIDIIPGKISGKPIALDFTENDLQEAEVEPNTYYQQTFKYGSDTEETKFFSTMNDVKSFTKENDNYLLRKILKELPEYNSSSANLYFYTVNHSTNIWDDGTNYHLSDNSGCRMFANPDTLLGGNNDSIYTFYKNNSSERDSYQTITDFELNAPKSGQGTNVAAMLFGGMLKNTAIVYTDYFYTSKIPSNKIGECPLLYMYVNDSGLQIRSGIIMDHFFIYAPIGKRISKDNWIVRYTEADGGQGVLNNADYYDFYFNLEKKFEPESDSDSPYTQKEDYDFEKGIICQIQTTLFYPDGTTKIQQKRRVCWNGYEDKYEWNTSEESSDFKSEMERIENNYYMYYGTENDYDFYYYNNDGKTR